MQITQAILPIAGLGTRFLPWTKVVPKELLPLGSKPIIALLVDECLSVGITDICFVINRGKEIVPQYFERNAALEEELARRGKSNLLADLARYNAVRFHTVYQNEQKGDGHAILQAAPWVTTEAVAVLFGDDLVVGEKNGLQQLIPAFEALRNADPSQPSPAILALEDVPRELVSKYGIADISGESPLDPRLKKVDGLVEKPSPKDAPSTLGVVGKYIAPRSTLDVLPDVQSGHGGEIRLIDAFIAQMEEIPIYGYQFAGKRLDTGTPEGYREAVMILG
jgi:UTP--glucose-1-phosphate uridylyltransferase